MPTLPPNIQELPYCQQCNGQSRWLRDASQDAWVDYFRCPHCGNVFARPKYQSSAPLTQITAKR